MTVFTCKVKSERVAVSCGKCPVCCNGEKNGE